MQVLRWCQTVGGVSDPRVADPCLERRDFFIYHQANDLPYNQRARDCLFHGNAALPLRYEYEVSLSI
jgi:hypothetical protein